MVRNFMVPTYVHWINFGHGNHNHSTIDHIQPIEITNELLRCSQGLSSHILAIPWDNSKWTEYDEHGHEWHTINLVN